MIGTIDICIQASKPNFPLDPVFSFVGSPSSFRVRNVPKKVGRWAIIKVYVSCEYPDGETNTAECVLTGGVWVGTVKDGATVSGKVDNGFTVVADGLDENGDLVQGYVLGMGDLAILANDSSIHPYLTGHRLTLFDTMPEHPKKGDSYLDDGWLRVYDGTQWSPKPEIEVPTRVSQLENDVPYAEQGDLETTSQAAYEALSQSTNNADAIVQLDGRVAEAEEDIDHLDGLVPSQASIDNQLADKDFVNSSINNVAAYYITKNADGDAFSSKAELDNATVYYCGGEIRTPTQNDYCLVQSDETKTTEQGNPTTRYSFQNGSWSFQYVVNNTPLTAEQIYILNNGATRQDVSDAVSELASYSYVDSEIGGAVYQAKSYADGKAESAEANAKGYADGIQQRYTFDGTLQPQEWEYYGCNKYVLSSDAKFFNIQPDMDFGFELPTERLNSSTSFDCVVRVTPTANCWFYGFAPSIDEGETGIEQFETFVEDPWVEVKAGEVWYFSITTVAPGRIFLMPQKANVVDNY